MQKGCLLFELVIILCLWMSVILLIIFIALSQLLKMSLIKEFSEESILFMKTVTWQKDSHSLFDYEFNNKVLQATFEFNLTPKFIHLLRNNNTHQIKTEEADSLICQKNPALQYLGAFQIKQDNKKIKLEFFNASDVRQKTGEETGRTVSSANEQKEEDIYLIVRSLKNKNNQNKGYKLNVGQILKLGRVQYIVTSMNNTHHFSNIQSKSKFWANQRKIMVPEDLIVEGDQCKYCMQGETEEFGQFLCSPCNCAGSCALVHFKCLQKWNQSKVKKEVVGGTTQYNFQKFYCEVCQLQYPRYIQKNGVSYELLPIEKPVGSHLMLEGITQKSNNMMVIQNLSHEGIKIGRGHDCQIRITDISVSRTHAKIQKIGDDYFVFDNKSKFGTLIKEEILSFELSKIKQGIQIGRTVITFEKTKKN